jgi:hypothetical protein
MYCPAVIAGVYSYRNVASAIDAKWTVDVDYYTELTERQPYNTESETITEIAKPLAQQDEDMIQPLSINSPPWSPDCGCVHK